MPTQNKRDFLLVGVTGGIGSGKSFVCSLFEHLGRTLLKADALAREITDTDPDVRREISHLLGRAAYPHDGPMDRKYVAEKVFSDHGLLRALDGIVHARVMAEIERISAGLPSAQRRPYVLVEAALIYESGMDEMLDQVIVVDAGEETRINRVMARDGVDRGAVLLRMAAQLPAARKVALADFVIANEKNSVSLNEKVRFLDTLLSAMAPAYEH